MKLIPRSAPGRTNRQARTFGDEIARLHHEGHGYLAIQQALADVGVVVSKSTVQREVARLSMPLPSHARQDFTRPIQPSRAPLESGSSETTTQRPDGRQRESKQLADAFMKGFITNPLIRRRS